MRKYYLIIAFIISLLSPLAIYAGDLKIAALLKTSTNPFFQLMWEGIKREADAAGLNVEVFWPESESDFEYQYDFLEHKASSYDVLLLSPSNPEGVVPYLPAIRHKGVKIIMLDIGLNSLPAGAEEEDYFNVFLGTDNEAGGTLAAKYSKQFLINKVSPRVIILGGFKSHMTSPGRTLMFEREILSFKPDARIIKFVANYDRNNARQIAHNNIDVFRNSDLIFCANDHMALGVIDEMLARGLELPPIIGYDSVKEAQQAILDGKLAASIVQFPARMGAEAIKAAIALTEGRPVQRQVLIPPAITVRKVQIETINP